jgi:signal transduction histidine kinase
VTDSGIGIKESEQSQLFQLFGFLDSSKELNSKGVGLGLHISKMITKQFGGDITLRSEYKVGS